LIRLLKSGRDVQGQAVAGTRVCVREGAARHLGCRYQSRRRPLSPVFPGPTTCTRVPTVRGTAA